MQLQASIVDPPVIALVAGIISVILLLVWLELPAFVGLIISTLVVGVITPEVPISTVPSETASEFGAVMGSIGIPILMAAIIGKSMTESGAAQRIVRGFRSVLSDEQSGLALFGSSFIISIPVFFDNVFFLLAPLARSMRARVGKDYALYIVLVTAGGLTAHAFIPPTPGPLAAANELGVDVGTTILIGLMVGIPTAVFGAIPYGIWINRRTEIPLRDSMGTTSEDIEELIQQPNSALPGIFESMLPILIAVLFVTGNTVMGTIFGEDSVIVTITSFIGDPNFALTAAAVTAAATYYRIASIDRSTWSDELTVALQSGGNMAAITCAGGAFGALLASAGVGNYIAGALASIGLGLLATAFLIAAGVRVVQGSATVAILTTAGVVAPLTNQLTVNPVYLIMAIGAGSICLSWYNDSGFWVVKEIGGLTQAETFKTWTFSTTVAGIVGFIITYIFSTLFPLV